MVLHAFRVCNYLLRKISEGEKKIAKNIRWTKDADIRQMNWESFSIVIILFVVTLRRRPSATLLPAIISNDSMTETWKHFSKQIKKQHIE